MIAHEESEKILSVIKNVIKCNFKEKFSSIWYCNINKSTIVFNIYKVKSENMGDPSAPNPRCLHQACIWNRISTLILLILIT